jgi:peptidoglycan/LPS O-acetylase OafA/YrhL
MKQSVTILINNSLVDQGFGANLRNISADKYRPDIDGLRAIAVVSVVIYHAFPELLCGGFVGVDIFFVISGFLISGIITDNLAAGTFDLLDFYRRRVKRIFPALVLVLTFTLTTGWVMLFANEYEQLGKHVAGGAAFISNFLLWGESGYFDNEASTKPLLHLWSLGVEEQFYMFWPIILWLGWKFRFNFLVLAFSISVLSFSLNIALMPRYQDAAFYSPWTRFWELMLGAVLAWSSYAEGRLLHGLNYGRLATLTTISKQLRYIFWGPFSRSLLSIFGLFLVVMGTVVVREKNFPSWWALIPALGAFFVISAGSRAYLNRVILSTQPFVMVGLFSYPLYLWHWPLLSFLKILQGNPPPSMRASAIAVSIILAWLTYQYIEKPVRFNKLGKGTALILCLLMLCIGSAGFAVYYMGGFKSRNVVRKNINLESGFDGGWPKYGRSCDFVKPEDRSLFYCAVDARGSPRYALIGDSKAGALFQGLFRTADGNANWLYIGSGDSGPLVPVISDDPIYRIYKKRPVEVALQIINKMESVDTVVIATSARALFQLKVDYSIEDLPESKSYAPARRGLGWVVSELISKGKRVVLLVDNPTLPHMDHCINRKTASDLLDGLLVKSSDGSCFLPIEKHRRLSKIYRDMLYEIEAEHHGKVFVFDATDILCDVQSGVCPPFKNDRPLYGVTDHISDYGATLVGRSLNDFLNSMPNK